MKITKAEIEIAHKNYSKLLPPTPMVKNAWLSTKYQAEIYLKLESMQPIGSFKIRGAINKMAHLSEKEKKKGVVAASAGNHAQGVAWAAKCYKTNSTIVMPLSAPMTKVENTKSLGAKVILHGDTFEQAYEFAQKLSQKSGALFIHPYQDQEVIAGQGSLGFEIVKDLPQFDYLIGAIGGGGLLSGLALALKAIKHPSQIIGAQASGARSMVESLAKGKLVQTGVANTFADGIRVKVASPVMFDILKENVNEVYHADDEMIASAILELMEKARIITEGAGALPLCILDQMFKKNPKKIKGKKIVLVICGGNIDVNFLGHIIDRGLTVSGRHLRLNLYVNDKPGTLNLLSKVIADLEGNILQVIHDRDNPKAKINETAIELTLETKGPDHSKTLVKGIQKFFPHLEVF
ncbi:MAG: threonine ammonia-lyase [Bacteriovoracaceae bacterium]